MSKLYIQNFPEVLKYSGAMAANASMSGSLPAAGYSQLVGYIYSSGSSETGSGLYIKQSVDGGTNWDVNSGCLASATAFTSSCMIDTIGNAFMVRYKNGATTAACVRMLFQLKPVAGTAKMPDVDIDVISSGSVTVTSGSLVVTAGSIDTIKGGSIIVTAGSVITTAGSLTSLPPITVASTALTTVSASTSASGETAIVASPAVGTQRIVVTSFVIQNESADEVFNAILRSGSARESAGDRWRMNASPKDYLSKDFVRGHEWRLDAGSPVVLFGSSSPIGYSLSYFTENA